VPVMDLARRFAQLVRRPEPEIPLDEASLIIAKCAQPSLSIEVELARLDALAADVRDGTLTGLLRLLFRDLGFSGNQRDYYDPRNSFLNEVIDRRTGIPISLAVLMIEVGRRAGVPLRGVGMPGHFLVRDMVDHDVFIDAFSGGRTLPRAACRRLFHEMHGPQTPFDERFLAPIGRDQILQRMLANLRNVYVQRDDTASLTWVLELRAQFPDAGADEYRELASVLSAHGAFDRAADAYENAARLGEANDFDCAEERALAAILRARLN
jgi:regulator of sirC expression with transglutaminase-like and TPR domain